MRDVEQIDRKILYDASKKIQNKIDEHFSVLKQQNPQNNLKLDNEVSWFSYKFCCKKMVFLINSVCQPEGRQFSQTYACWLT